MQRRIEQADGHREAFHLAIESDEVLLLQWQQLREISLSLFPGARQNHLLHDRNAVFREEHMLRTAETDAFRAEPSGDLGLIRDIGIGPDMERSELIRPIQE